MAQTDSHRDAAPLLRGVRKGGNECNRSYAAGAGLHTTPIPIAFGDHRPHRRGVRNRPGTGAGAPGRPGPAATGFWRDLLAALRRPRRAAAAVVDHHDWHARGHRLRPDLGFWHYGIAYTAVGKATVLANRAVIVTAIAWIVFKQRRPICPASRRLVRWRELGRWRRRRGSGWKDRTRLGDALSLTTSFW